MKLLILGLNHAPELVGIGKYTGEMSAFLVAAGHQVRVITAPPYYPAWQVTAGFRRWWWQSESREGARVIRCPLYVPRRPSGMKRLLHLLSFAVTALPVALWQALVWRPQAVLAVAPALTSAPVAWLAARLCGAKVWLHLQDFEVEAAFSLGLLKSRRLQSMALRSERCLLRRFDKVSTIAPQMLQRLKDKGVVAERLFLLRNWVDCQALRPGPDPIALRRELGLAAHSKVVLYAGNMGEKQGLELVAAAAEQMKDRGDLVFLLVGEGSQREELQRRLAPLPSVRFLPLQPLDRLQQLFALASLQLLPQRADAADLVLPSKLTGILASGRPVITTAARGTGLADEIEGVGLVTPPGDIAAFVAAIERLLDDPELCGKLGEAGRGRALDRWDRQIVLPAFEQALGRLVAPGSLASKAPLE